MNKQEFLSSLKVGLKGLPESEIAEIVAEYEDHFRNALERGKTEQQICLDMGSVDQIVQGYKINRIIEEGDKASFKIKPILRAALILLAMAPFNFLVFMGPFFVSIVMLITFWSLSGALCLVSLAAAFVFPISLGGVFGLMSLLGSVGMLSLSVVFILLLIPITKGIATLVFRYLKWNLDFARGQ